jgi:hypothetical protein
VKIVVEFTGRPDLDLPTLTFENDLDQAQLEELFVRLGSAFAVTA